MNMSIYCLRKPCDIMDYMRLYRCVNFLNIQKNILKLK